MSEPPTPGPAEGGEWRPLADQDAVNVKNFIDGVAALAQGGGDETVPLLLLEVSQILLAGAQLGASSDVIPAGNWEPEVGEHDLLIRVRACAVCHTDLHIVEGEIPLPRLPVVPGHQIVGTVERAGPAVSRFRVGDRVGVPWLNWADGTCEYCRRDQENLCDNARSIPTTPRR